MSTEIEVPAQRGSAVSSFTETVEAIREFYDDIVQALRSVGPDSVEGPAGSPDTLRLDLFLSRRVTAAFRPDDWAFLPADEWAKLTAAVVDFDSVAASLSPTAPANPEQRLDGLAALQRIADILALDRFDGPESLVVGKALENEIVPPLPDYVERLEVRPNRTSEDSTLDILVILRPDGASFEEQDEVFFGRAKELRRRLFEFVSVEKDVPFWPLLRFRTSDEHADLAAALEAV